MSYFHDGNLDVPLLGRANHLELLAQVLQKLPSNMLYIDQTLC